MKNSEIYKTAIQAIISREENVPTMELTEEAYLECLYKLTQDWYWSREAEKDKEFQAREAKAMKSLGLPTVNVGSNHD